MFGGDLAQLGKKEELDHGLEIMSNLRGKPAGQGPLCDGGT